MQSHWGGPDSASKREWFAGAVVELFLPANTTASTDNTPIVEDVEERLLQIMEDEFEVIVDDDSSVEIATSIIELWRDCMKGDFAGLERLQEQYARNGEGRQVIAQAVASDNERVDDEDFEDFEDEEGDVEMGDAVPTLVGREKAVAEVDEEGFTRVVGRRKGR